VQSVLATGRHASGLVVDNTLGDIYVDDLTVEDCTANGILFFSGIGTLHVTNSNLLRCNSSGLFSLAKGNIVLEDIFIKGNGSDGIQIVFANTVVIKNSKALENVLFGINLLNVNSVDMDDVLAASNGDKGISLSSSSLTKAAFKDIVVLDNGFADFFLDVDTANNPKVTIEDFVACNTGSVGESQVVVSVPNGVLEVKKDFVASTNANNGSTAGCCVQDKNNVLAACSASPLTKKNLKLCAGFCSQ
jgi:hypothetical protein